MEGLGIECISDASEEGEATQALTSSTSSKEVPMKPAQAGSGKDPKEKDLAVPFLFNDSFPPIPAKLVEKIQVGEFVDMAELLRDNIELERRKGQGESGANSKLPCREVPDVLSWCGCRQAPRASQAASSLSDIAHEGGKALRGQWLESL